MPLIEIYTTAFCPYCVRAKQLLDSKQLEYQEIRVDKDSKKLQEMLTRSNGRRSVPQIFIKGEGIGGFDELYSLELDGQLDDMLKS